MNLSKENLIEKAICCRKFKSKKEYKSDLDFDVRDLDSIYNYEDLVTMYGDTVYIVVGTRVLENYLYRLLPSKLSYRIIYSDQHPINHTLHLGADISGILEQVSKYYVKPIVDVDANIYKILKSNFPHLITRSKKGFGVIQAKLKDGGSKDIFEAINLLESLVKRGVIRRQDFWFTLIDYKDLLKSYTGTRLVTLRNSYVPRICKLNEINPLNAHARVFSESCYTIIDLIKLYFFQEVFFTPNPNSLGYK